MNNRHLQLITYMREQCLLTNHPLGASLQADDSSVIRMLFLNYRNGKGLRLTTFGLQHCKTFFQAWDIDLGEGFQIRPRHTLFMDRTSTYPWHLQHNHLTLFDQDLAMKIKLLGSFDTFLDMIQHGAEDHIPARDRAKL